MKPLFPKIRVRMPFALGHAVQYEDYLGMEYQHFLGMASEDSRTYYDEVRWVIRYQKRDWYRGVHAVLLLFPLLVGVLFLAIGEHLILSGIGLALTVASGLWALYATYRFILVKREVAVLQSSRGSVEIGVDWPRSSNPRKDANVFFESLLGRLKLVQEIPQPAPPAPPPVVAAPEVTTESVPPPPPPPAAPA